MAALYHIETLELQELNIKLSVQVIHPDSNIIYESPGFALMLLYDTADTNSALRQEIDSELLFNESWMQNNARGFIRSVSLKMDKPSRKNWLKGILEINVTHSEWLSHMKNTKEWDSGAFELVDTYDECADIFPEIIENAPFFETDSQSKEGLIPIWKYIIPLYLLSSNKEILWFSKYGQSAYKPSNTDAINDFSEASMLLHEGTLVKTDEEFGVLYKRENDWGTFSIGTSSCCSSYVKGNLIPMVLNTRKKLSNPINIETVIKFSFPIIFDANIVDSTIEFKVMVMREEQEISIQSNQSALKFLMKPFETSSAEEYEKGWPLSDFLNVMLKEFEIPKTRDLYTNYTDIVDKVIVNTRVEKSLGFPYPNLTDLNNEEIIELYEYNKWPQYTIKIQVSDSTLLKNYEKKLPFCYIF